MASALKATPWRELPPDVVVAHRDAVIAAVPEIIETIQREVPEYARPMEGRFGEGVKRGLGVALDRFFHLPGTTEPALTEDSRRVYIGLGGGEVRQGRSLESLLAAYRTGARVVFRRLARAVQADGAPTSVVIALGESVFAYIDEISAASVEGYAREQSDRASDLDRRRSEIAALLLIGGADELTLQRLAVEAGWRLPDDVAVVVVPSTHADGLRLALGPQCLLVSRPTETLAIVPASVGRAELTRALQGRGAVVGPQRPWLLAPESARLAHTCAALAAGAEPAPTDPPTFYADRLLDVVLSAEPAALADLARLRLAPLADERPASRERLLETLAAWLAHDGHRVAIGRELHIHPQTVGYRVGRLRELFGEALDDPRVRFELELVLRAGAA